jgi:signal transduction histidine kinase
MSYLPKTGQEQQLHTACKLTHAQWAAWLVYQQNQWEILITSGISKNVLNHFKTILRKDQVNRWLAGALSTGRVRWRESGSEFLPVGGKRVFIIPNPETMQILFVLADNLDKQALALFRVVGLNPPQLTAEFQTYPHDILPPSSTSVSLDEILSLLVQKLHCQSALIGVRRGDIFRIQAGWKCREDCLGKDIHIQQSAWIQSILLAETVILTQPELQEIPIIQDALNLQDGICMILPVVVSSRVIGIISFAYQINHKPISDLQKESENLVEQIAYSFENSILFSEATRYLQQLALLNELASTASSDIDIDQVARRVMLRLRRVFNTDWAGVYLLTGDQLSLREYGGQNSRSDSNVIPLKETVIGYAFRSGQPIVVNDLEATQSLPNNERLLIIRTGSRAELAVPLKYRGTIIGVISLVSGRFNTFTSQDEQLLTLIASHLAGVFENMRLNRETQERAEMLQRLYQELQESQQALIQTEKMATAGRLMASIAHEINNPLQALENCLHLAGRMELSETTRRNYLQLASDELTRLMKTVQRMLDYYRPGGLDRKPTDIHDILHKTLILVQKQLEDHRIDVQLQLNPQLPLTLMVGDQIQQVFLNLILNAIEAMPEGGQLWIETNLGQKREDGSEIEIIFEDTGPGIPPKQRSQIFEPFISHKPNGTGLGLAVSYGIINAHEGNLEVVDGRSTGACFRITLKGSQS